MRDRHVLTSAKTRHRLASPGRMARRGIRRPHDQVREHIRPWVGPSFVTDNVDGARNTIRRYADRQAADSGGLYGIWSHGDLVGGVMFTRFCEAEGMCEVGCWVCPEFEGRGLVTEACRVLIDWAFIDRGLHRAEWHCRADNDRSIAVAKRLGMTLEGVMRSSWPYQGVRYDTQVWAVLAHEWRSRCGDHTKRPHGPEPRHARTDCFRAPSICELCVYDLALFDSPRATLQASPGGTQHRSCPISATFFVNSMFTHGTRPATCSLGVKQPRKPCRRGALTGILATDVGSTRRSSARGQKTARSRRSGHRGRRGASSNTMVSAPTGNRPVSALTGATPTMHRPHRTGQGPCHGGPCHGVDRSSS